MGTDKICRRPTMLLNAPRTLSLSLPSSRNLSSGSRSNALMPSEAFSEKKRHFTFPYISFPPSLFLPVRPSVRSSFPPSSLRMTPPPRRRLQDIGFTGSLRCVPTLPYLACPPAFLPLPPVPTPCLLTHVPHPTPWRPLLLVQVPVHAPCPYPPSPLPLPLSPSQPPLPLPNI